MVERSYNLDAIFSSLRDATRRDILRRVSRKGMSVSELADCYDFSLGAIAKQIDVLENAGLVQKTRKGKEKIITFEPQAMEIANEYLETFRQHWEQRLDSLDKYLNSINK